MISLSRALREAYKSDDSVRLLKNALPNTPTMDQFYHYKGWHEEGGTVRSDVNGLYIIHSEDYHDLDEFGEFIRMRRSVKQAFFDDYCNVGAGAIISEITIKDAAISGLPTHSDQTNQIHWACVGSSLWKTFVGEKTFSFLMEPGDVLFIRKGTLHKVDSITPRAGIIMSVGTELEGYEREKSY